MKPMRLISLLLLISSLIVFAGGTKAAGAAHTRQAVAPCGVGTIAFRARIGAKEKRFTCSEGSWYDGGVREYIAHFKEAPKSRRVTLVVIHVQVDGSERGVLFRRVTRVRNLHIAVLRGTIDFSSVYRIPPPAGAPPFGTYLVAIHRGSSARGELLAQGAFQVIED
jgi:hypothetical protein